MNAHDFAFGYCHGLTAALISFRPAGEAFGLFVDGSCIHSAFRAPHTAILIDAFGAEVGESAFAQKAARYCRPGDLHEWRTLTEGEIQRMVPGSKSRVVRAARTLAKVLLQNADAIEAAHPPLPVS